MKLYHLTNKKIKSSAVNWLKYLLIYYLQYLFIKQKSCLKLDCVCLFGINPVWSLCMIENIYFLSLFAKILLTILVSMGIRDTGQLESTSGLSLPGFVIKAIFVQYICIM